MNEDKAKGGWVPREKEADWFVNKAKTINTQDSLLVTDATTNKATMGLNYAEQTGSVLVPFLWSIAERYGEYRKYITVFMWERNF